MGEVRDKMRGMAMNVASPPAPWFARLPIVGARASHWDSIDWAFGGIFIFASIFYIWTAATSQPLTLHGGSSDRYNLLANALLHLHLSVGHAPAQLLNLADPYNPEENRLLLHGPTDATSIGDDLLYNGNLYFVWGPGPALVLLIPLHLLGFEPSASVTGSVFAIAGVGFALAALRVLIRKIGNETLWICILAGLAVAFSSVIPFLLRYPYVTDDTIACGYCFTMAGIWLAFSAIADRRASPARVTVMSLCFGLAVLSRPALVLVALILVPVYTSLRPGRSRRELLMTLAGPVGVCCLLLLAYNQARFHQPLEFGARYQLSGYDSRTAPLHHLGYVLPGAWPYVWSLPRLSIVFPFILLTPPALTSPAGLAAPEMTGGLLPMTPIVIFLAALPWLWRRRPAALGTLALALIILAGVGLLIMILPAYQFFAPTERYTVEFSTLFVLGGLAGWLALSTGPRTRRRQLVRIGGGILIVWGCLMGWATSIVGYTNVLALNHPGTWATLEDIGSPLSTLIAQAAGHPVMASVSATNLGPYEPVRYTGLGFGPNALTLSVDEQARFTVVSPDHRRASLVGLVSQRHQAEPSFPPVAVHIKGPGGTSHNYPLPAANGEVLIPVELNRGVNHFVLSPQLTVESQTNPRLPVLLIENLKVAEEG
ncbi:MAG TPA: hypothetical protein VGH60_10610 [Solirubrobacteraceae bacterium]|jgi:hypothetical protein